MSSRGAHAPGRPTARADASIDAALSTGSPVATADLAASALLRRGVQVERRVTDLGLPVAVWRRLVDVAAAQAGMRLLTYLVPAEAHGVALDDQLVIAVLLGCDPSGGQV
jgi:hypothetical protein